VRRRARIVDSCIRAWVSRWCRLHEPAQAHVHPGWGHPGLRDFPMGPGRIRPSQRDDSAAAAKLPAAIRAERHDVQPPQSRIQSRLEHSGTREGTVGKRQTCMLEGTRLLLLAENSPTFQAL